MKTNPKPQTVKEKCFACGKTLGKNPSVADTRDGQTVLVGRECFKMINDSGKVGYRPPQGGPRLWLLKATGEDR